MSYSTLPTQLYRAEQVRQLDALAINSGIPAIQLMKRAGRAAFHLLRLRWPEARQLIVCCGGGNNGGDGYVIAALAAEQKLAVTVVAVSDQGKLAGEALQACNYARQEGVPVMGAESLPQLLSDAGEDTVIVDALLGTGLSGDVRDRYKTVIAQLNDCRLPVLAVDIPSGLCSDSGQVLGAAVSADVTVTFIGCKQGLFTGRAPELVGELVFDDLGTGRDPALAEQMQQLAPASCRISTMDLRACLPDRPADAHKGMYGHVMVIGGDTGFGGAAAMAAEACARSGAGLTSVATRPVHLSAILARLPEVMVSGVASGQELEPLLARPSILVLGPGLGQSPWSEQMLQKAVAAGLPMVVDADALNLMAQGRVVSNLRRDDWVLTPHPGEAARLLNCSVADIQADRFGAALQLQQRFGGVVVLKGAGTVIADDTGLAVASVGNPGMASGGMGDVLAGLVGGLLAQGLSPVEAASLAVCVHGDAADLAAAEVGQRGMLATDLIPYIRELLV